MKATHENGIATYTDIGGLVDELCDLFGVEKTECASIEIFPASIRLTVYLVNEDGEKWFDHDRGRPAMDTRTFRVKT